MSHQFSGQRAAVDDLANDVEWVIRPYREEDIPAIVALQNAIDAAYKLGEGISEEDLRLRLKSPRFDPARQIMVVEGSLRDGMPLGMLSGSGSVSYEDDESTQERIYYPRVMVHPGAEGRGLERVIANELIGIARVLEAEREQEPARAPRVKAWVREEMTAIIGMWKDANFREVRQFWNMARPLDVPIDEPQPIDGVNIRSYKRPEDNVRARTAFDNSFADHWDHHPIPQEDWDHRASSSSMRPELSWLAEVEENPDNIAGFCICAISDEENKRRKCCEGWIELLGTTRDWRRKGLGRALLLHGLLSLRSAGMDTALLGVDSESPTGANRLYESVGFRIRSRDVTLQCSLDEIKI